ncbi:MAG: ATP-binding protein, partial [Clostridia bacterium]|nr:ATP-binding protein [Clostridia bacterium]
MKERAINNALAIRQSKIDAAKRLAEVQMEKALAISEISSAYSAFLEKRFSAYRQGNISEIEVEKAHDAYISALKKHGFSETDFDYTPLCPICGDKGNVDGKACKCVWTEYIKQLKIVCDIEKRAKFTFANCDTKTISDEAQRATLEKLYAYMSKYAAKLPDVKTKNIVLSGTVGTGKTCLASAVARATVEGGKSCKFLSAYEFNTEMLSCHTSPIAERADKLHDVLTADLLVLDDLGTEPRLQNVTI